jgi:hypothetical protein
VSYLDWGALQKIEKIFNRELADFNAGVAPTTYPKPIYVYILDLE